MADISIGPPSTTMAPTTMAPTTFMPTMAPTTMPPTMAPTTMAPTTFMPTMAPTTTAPTVAPTPSTSPTGFVTVAVCISGSSAIVTLEQAFSMTTSFDGANLAPVTFAAFNTANNSYPAHTVSGELVAGNLEVTVDSGASTSTFMLSSGSASECAVV